MVASLSLGPAGIVGGGSECTALSPPQYMTEVPLSKAPNPKLLPGCCSINGCPLLRVCVNTSTGKTWGAVHVLWWNQFWLMKISMCLKKLAPGGMKTHTHTNPFHVATVMIHSADSQEWGTQDMMMYLIASGKLLRCFTSYTLFVCSGLFSN